MKYKKIVNVIMLSLPLMIYSCENNKRKKVLENFKYETFKDSMSIENYDATQDTANIFDAKAFTPGVDSFETLLIRIDTLWHLEKELMEKQDLMKKIVRTKEKYTVVRLPPGCEAL